MKKYRKKLVSMVLIVAMMITMLPASASELGGADVQEQIVSDELLGVMGVTYAELLSGDYEDFGETYSCIIWIEDIDMEMAVCAGIDAAEATRETYTIDTTYDYPYTVMEINGMEVVEVEIAENENLEYVDTYIETERATAAEMYKNQNSKFV